MICLQYTYRLDILEFHLWAVQPAELLFLPFNALAKDKGGSSKCYWAALQHFATTYCSRIKG